jgi:hypothetical protein
MAGTGLLALVGCNQVFGITPTRENDARVTPDPHVVLDWQIAEVLASGAPDPMPRFAPIDPPPRVRIAPLDGPFDIDPVPYSTTDGSILIPPAYLNTTWRLEYTLAGGVPHEVQWAPEDQQGHLTVPLFGRLQRDPVPVDSGYTITPSAVTSYSHPRVFTTGLWTEGVASNYVMSDGGRVDYDFYKDTLSLSGPRGRPDPALGDRALLVDFADGSMINGTVGCRIAAGSAPLASAALEPGAHSVEMPTWDTGQKDVRSTPIDTKLTTRLGTSLGMLGVTFSSAQSMLLFGYTANTNMPGLAGAPNNTLLPGVQLPVPVMLALLQCPISVITLPKASQPALLDPFPRILHAQLVANRQVLGVTLASGMETVIPAASTGDFTMAFPAAIPLNFELMTPMNGLLNLAGGSDQLAAGPASGIFELTFTRETIADVQAHYYDVVLHRIAAGTLITERIYTVTEPMITEPGMAPRARVRIDGMDLAPNADYVFEVRSYKGHPQAQNGDFAPVDYPYGAAIVFTRTFKTS